MKPTLPAENISDLFARVAKGDHLAYEEVFNRFADSLYAVAFAYGRTHELAEDAVQQVFLKLWERRDTLGNVENAEAWLHTAARYQMLDMLEKEFNRIRHIGAAAHLVKPMELPVTERLIEKERLQIIEAAVRALPSRQQDIYRMVREQGLGYAEIGGRMGLSRETIKDYMSQALKSLRRTLGAQRDRLLAVSLFVVKNIF